MGRTWGFRRFVAPAVMIAVAVVAVPVGASEASGRATPPANGGPVPSSITNGILRSTVDLYFDGRLRFAGVRSGATVRYTFEPGRVLEVAAFVARGHPPAAQPRRHALADHHVLPGALLLSATHAHHAHFETVGPHAYRRTPAGESRLYVVNTSVAKPLRVEIDGKTAVANLRVDAHAFVDVAPARHTITMERNGRLLAGVRLPFRDGVLTTIHLISNLTGGHWALTSGTTRLGTGYRLLAGDGGVFAFGSRSFLGSMGARTLWAPIVGGAETPSSAGYWMVASDGGVFTFGDAPFYGSTGGLHLRRPIVGMAPTPSGNGYWLVAADGGVFAFGDARFFGSNGSLDVPQPVAAIAPSPTGAGYWMLARDGGVFAFGDAKFFGAAAGTYPGHAAVAIAPNRNGTGYSIVFDDGRIDNFGFVARTGRLLSHRDRVVAFRADAADDGYWEITELGNAYRFGNVSRFRGLHHVRLHAPVVAMI
jgi:hypothetical protein